MVTFRKMGYDDVPFFNRVRNSVAKEFLHDSRVFTLEESIKWFKLKADPYYIIENNGVPIGYFRTSWMCRKLVLTVKFLYGDAINPPSPVVICFIA